MDGGRHTSKSLSPGHFLNSHNTMLICLRVMLGFLADCIDEQRAPPVLEPMVDLSLPLTLYKKSKPGPDTTVQHCCCAGNLPVDHPISSTLMLAIVLVLSTLRPDPHHTRHRSAQGAMNTRSRLYTKEPGAHLLWKRPKSHSIAPRVAGHLRHLVQPIHRPVPQESQPHERTCARTAVPMALMMAPS